MSGSGVRSRPAWSLLLVAVLVAWPAAPGGVPSARAAAAGPDVQRPDAVAARVAPDLDALAGPRSAGADDDGWLDDEVAGELTAVLAELAAALGAADEQRLAARLLDPEGEVGQRWRDRAANLGEVPFDAFHLRLDPRPGLMTTERVRARYPDADQLVVVGVVEEHVLEGQDVDGPARHRHTLTFVREDGAWLLAEDRDGRVLGRPEPGFLWDLVPVAATRRGPVLVLHPADAVGVEQLAADTAAAMEVLPARWPGPWSPRATLVVPGDGEQLAHVVGGSLHLDDFLAFTSATTHSGPGTHELSGTRLIVNPDRFPSGAQARERVLLHELVHVASRPLASARLPLWLEEGIAQALGEQGPSTGHTRQLDAAGPAGRRLPTDAEFGAVGREATFLAYQRAYRFIDHLVAVSGRDAVVDFYRAVGESATGPGTLGHRLDTAAEQQLGADLATLVARWRAAG